MTELALKFNFTEQTKPGYMAVTLDAEGRAPLYDPTVGYGFVEETCTLPPRTVHAAGIRSDGAGFSIVETAFDAEPGFEGDEFNRYGMAFRFHAPPGAYRIRVKLTSDAAQATVSVSGMHGDRLLQDGHWDAAKRLPIRFNAEASGSEWTYTYVNGFDAIEIEIEPTEISVPVGLAEIALELLPPQTREDGRVPNLFILGDSTVKTYTFDEAPMSGWGQIVGSLFDADRVNVVNYSMGGRSFKNSYWEGRLNEILLEGCVGDYILIQFGHNDESYDEKRRFGRGSTEEMYAKYMTELYLPAIRARGLIPVMVTPMSRVDGEALSDVFTNSFVVRQFPALMERLSEAAGITLVDLNAESLKFYNESGLDAISAIVMSIEAGETAGKTNDGSYANGHPAGKIDGTHYKEALAKPFARIVATELVRLGRAGDPTAAAISSFLLPAVKDAASTGDWSAVFPEMTRDTTVGPNAYYRNQIEKLIQLGVMHKDAQGNFRPHDSMTVSAFKEALSLAFGVQPSSISDYPDGELTRETMAAILVDAYHARFPADKPRFMTDYNGASVVPGDPGYDPYLDSGTRGAMYYPLVSFGQLTDTAAIAPELFAKAKEAYELGLIRSEAGIARGRMANGTAFEPKTVVTRAKAAKALYFMWVLRQDVQGENQVGALD
ncbi:Lysophospholipase L1 [Cohnella sp. OV330]|uniref:GDSL-type esterase/lipase family protein n=1 Tax=Cohnella sp. OV330 TaxID=1855288 RepID=UPI0008E7D66A|nr:GDSL-type esterase/lipase family protein [Cohnella sp. OV330]SFA75997.1 Lysophospholipase L1 [Cohnella sp. OV330]